MRLLLLRARLAALGVLFVSGLALQAPAASCDVLLNEILAAPAQDWNGDGSVSSRDDEWIEIYNTGTSDVDLGTLLLSDADSTVRIRLAGVLAPGAHLVVYGGNASDWQRDNGRSVTGLSLNNAGDTVRLWQIQGPDTLQVDAYQYKSHESTSERASGRQPDGGEWTLFDGLNPYGGSAEPSGSGCDPSPGSANDCSTQSEASTWGRVKGAYR